MLTNKDIEKIVTANREVFATKEDLKIFATKEDLKQFATEEDLDNKFNKAFEVFAAKEDIKDLRKDIDGLRESVQALTLSVDKLVKIVSDLSQEYAAMAAKIDRHERWIQEIAVKIGVQLKS